MAASRMEACRQPVPVLRRALLCWGQARQSVAELAALQRQRDLEARAGRPAAPAPDNVLGHWVQRSEASRLTARPRLPVADGEPKGSFCFWSRSLSTWDRAKEVGHASPAFARALRSPLPLACSLSTHIWSACDLMLLSCVPTKGSLPAQPRLSCQGMPYLQSESATLHGVRPRAPFEHTCVRWSHTVCALSLFLPPSTLYLQERCP